MCVDKNNTKDLIDGYRCDCRDCKLVGDTCIIYEKIKANSN
mgnify:CR=1 FL=1